MSSRTVCKPTRSVAALLAALMVALFAAGPVSGLSATAALAATPVPTEAPAATPAAAPPVAQAAPAAAPAPKAESTAASKDLEQKLDADVQADEADFVTTMGELRGKFRAAMGALKTFPSDLKAALDREEPYGEVDRWVMDGIGIALIGIVAGLVIAIPLERWAIGRPVGAPAGQQIETNTRIAFLLRRAAIWLVGTAVVLIVGLVVLELLDKGHDLEHGTALTVLMCFAGVRAAASMFRTVITPGLPEYRIVHLEDREARSLGRGLTLFAALFAVVVGMDFWLHLLQLPREPRHIASLVLSVLLLLLLVVLCVTERRSVTKALGWRSTGFAGWLARNWWAVAILYFVAAWAVRAVEVLLDARGGAELVVVPVLLVFAGLGLQGIARLVLAQIVRRSPELRVGGPAGRRLPDFRDLAYTASALAITLIALALLLETWGLSFARSGAGITAIKVGLICLFGYIVYESIRIGIERKLAMEGAIPGVVAVDLDGDQPLAAGQSRIATLLPLVRVFLLAAVLCVSALMVLSELGVQVAPLFAGAGILGLAIGFGSQTLVHDIMSGAFFLVDDAFRVGEYVDIGSAKGVVERISIRSFQLRHQNGQLQTIPFSGIKQITNFSRDWQVAKLPFKFPFGTDVEKVRKVIKKVGERLAGDPELGPKFLAPIKSQGVSEIDSSGVTIRVKFMTRPNDLFLVKRQAYVALTKAFEEAGLELSNNIVTVRIESDGKTEITEEVKQAIAGAAASAASAPPAGAEG
ncbi:Small-conductance mechanosensitive channel [Pseudoxanthobacter soli DSM 19599]|uniref:Small-conductance mechanosensitive channel n=1 Tax=Pseudoxanthobacter soli DSM 19599 TaxID=1123029 RepID=A0A1M7ZD57_9HYPH|nr:mechanosensitive ion channel family protein [Pseudoxanthobacter soli]SHO62803.1 Small-conductance mechanosensitive channel [Pseudoxanthobacter soli DSM 19599]